jgi:hypothetical protein
VRDRLVSGHADGDIIPEHSGIHKYIIYQSITQEISAPIGLSISRRKKHRQSYDT